MKVARYFFLIVGVLAFFSPNILQSNESITLANSYKLLFGFASIVAGCHMMISSKMFVENKEDDGNENRM